MLGPNISPSAIKGTRQPDDPDPGQW